MYNQKGPQGFIPIVVMLLIALTIGGYFIYQNQQESVSKPISATQQTTQPISTPSAVETTVQITKECNNSILGISLVKSGKWQCESRILSSEDGIINIKSDLFNIEISNLGRGPYCGEGESGDICQQINFLTNDKVKLTLYKYKGENKEIFGSFSRQKSNAKGKVWIAITYKNMEKTELSTEAKAELTSFLSSVTYSY